MKRFHFNLDWGSDAKYNDSRKNIRSVSGKIFCEFETQKLRLKIKTPSFFNFSVSRNSIKVTSGKHGRLQARISGENWVSIPTLTYWQKIEFSGLSRLWSKKSKGTWKTLRSRNKRFSEYWKIRSVANRLYPWKFTGSTHTFAFILYSKLNSPHFFAASSSILFLNANITIKSYQEGK